MFVSRDYINLPSLVICSFLLHALALASGGIGRAERALPQLMCPLFFLLSCFFPCFGSGRFRARWGLQSPPFPTHILASCLSLGSCWFLVCVGREKNLRKRGRSNRGKQDRPPMQLKDNGENAMNLKDQLSTEQVGSY